MKNHLSKETEERLRSELAHMVFPRKKVMRKKGEEMILEEKRTKKEEEEEKEEKESFMLSHFTEYLDKLRHDKQQYFNNKTPIEQIEEEFHHPIFDSDSPITMGSSVSEKEDGSNGGDRGNGSNGNSGCEEDSGEEEEEVITSIHHSRPASSNAIKKYKKLTYKDVERSLDFYEDEESKCLNELDILTTFLRGQTHLYSLSQYLTQQKINLLTIPSFIFSIAVTVIAPLIHDYVWSGILISALTATIASLFACVQFYELDASCNSYLLLSNQYNKMQISLETISNSLVMGTNRLKGVMGWKKVLEKIQEVEKKITEIKDSNTFLPPEEVKIFIPIISHIDIFSFIKKMKVMKKANISKYRKIKNEIRYILNQWEQYSYENEISESILVYEPIIDSSHSSHSSSCSKYATGMGGLGEMGEIGGMGNRSPRNMKDTTLPQHPWKKKQQQMVREKHRMSCLLKKKSEIRKELNYYHTAYSYIDEIFTREINLVDNTSHWWVFIRWFFGIHINNLPHNNPVVDKYLEFIFIQPSSSYRYDSGKDYDGKESVDGKDFKGDKHKQFTDFFESENDFDMV